MEDACYLIDEIPDADQIRIGRSQLSGRRLHCGGGHAEASPAVSEDETKPTISFGFRISWRISGLLK
jgi:hypothetical protein